MRWVEVSLTAPPASTDAVSAALIASGWSGSAVEDPSAVSSAPFVDSEGPPRPGGPCTVRAYLPLDDRVEAAVADLRERLDTLRESGVEVAPEISLRTLDEDWAEAWKAYFKPLRIGRRFVVRPSWEPFAAEPEDRVIELDPGMAFGSGTHPTTQLCLRLMEEVVHPGDRVLDWGTGSGILAVGAALLGAADVVAVDLDPVAVEAATANAERNGVAGLVRVSLGSIEDVRETEPFDRVVANILAAPIVAGASEVRRRVRSKGHAIVSGIIDAREAEVREALEAAGLRLRRTLAEAEWRALLFEAPG